MIHQDSEIRTIEAHDLEHFVLSTEPIDVRLGALFAERGLYENIPPYQRGFTWPKDFCQGLVDTILRGGPIPPILANRYRNASGRSVLSIIDGQQRMGAICGFRDGKFPTATLAQLLSLDHTPIPALDPGKRYHQLAEPLRSAFDDYSLRFIILGGANDDVLSIMFRRWQRQQILSPGEILWSYDGSAANLARHLDSLSIWKALYAGKTNRRETYQMSLYAVALQASQMQEGPYMTLKLSTLNELASRFGNTYLTDTVKQAVHRNMRAVEWVFDGTKITAKSEFIPLYQAVIQLERAGFDALASERGCLSDWFGEVRNYHDSIMFHGRPHILSQMVNLNSQRRFWIGTGGQGGHLEALLQQRGLVKHVAPITQLDRATA